MAPQLAAFGLTPAGPGKERSDAPGAPAGCEHHAADTGTPHGQGSTGGQNKPTSTFLLANAKARPLVVEIYN